MPATTSPMWIPILVFSTAESEPTRAFSDSIDSMISRPAWTDRWTSSSWAIGYPKNTRTPSPRYLATWPWCFSTMSRQVNW